jgi:hypothetical protein
MRILKPRKKAPVLPVVPETNMTERKMALRVLKSDNFFQEDRYEFDDTFRPGNTANFASVHTMQEIMSHLEQCKETEAEGIFLEVASNGVYRYRRLSNKEQIKEAWQKNSRLKKMREAKFREDTFATDGGPGSNGGLIGDDYTPLLGGPFNKQPYLYDYLRAHAYAFQQYHHEPFARAIIHITRDFVLGGGYRIDCEDQRALAMWRAFEQVNRLEQMMEQVVVEGSTYGENMIWWVPNQSTFISWNVAPGQEPAQGLIPRIRLIDPSTCWEVVTFPEDITRVLYYQLVFPTQYQIYTGRMAGATVPTSKFIMQQLPAEDVMHFKYNSMSNEKRGRSDLFPIFGYLKWIRDCVNYKLVAEKKQSAWTEDIIVQGSQADVDALTNALGSLGEFEPAGSRFIHTDKIKREYLAAAAGGKESDAFTWGLNMVAAGSQIPVTYFGLSHSAGQTRASALVGTEPVAKKFERRQNEVKRILEAIWRKFQDSYGVKDAECEITFPEIITQDRSAKLKDIKFVEDCGYLSRSKAAPMAVKELDVDNYDYDQEKIIIAQEENPPIMPTVGAPLTAPPAVGGNPGNMAPKPAAANPAPASPSSSAVTQGERRNVDMNSSH